MLVIRLLLSATMVLTVAAQDILPGTRALTMEGDLAAQMVDGINKWLIRETNAIRERRSSYWQRDYSSPAAYDKSISPNRDHLRRIIGATDRRVAAPRMMRETSTSSKLAVGRGAGYQ